MPIRPGALIPGLIGRSSRLHFDLLLSGVQLYDLKGANLAGLGSLGSPLTHPAIRMSFATGRVFVGLCPIHRGFIAMSGPRALAVHSGSISTTSRIPVAWRLKLLHRHCSEDATSRFDKVSVNVADHFGLGFSPPAHRDNAAMNGAQFRYDTCRPFLGQF